MDKLKLLLSTGVFSIIFLLIVFFHTHGLIPYDEGWFLQAGKRILDGDKIYKDFEFLYNPGGAYLNSFAFKFFGESVLSSRLFAILNSFFGVFLIFYIFRKIKLNGTIPTIFILTYVFWGAGHINFIWPVMICLTGALFSGALFLKSIESKRKTQILFLIGIISAGTFIFKQNFGLAIILGNFIFLFLFKEFRNLKLIFSFILGLSVTALLHIFYFFYLGILNEYLSDIYFYTIVKIFQEGILNSSLPWNYPAPILIQTLKFFFYLSPFFISFFAVLRLGKNKKLIYFPIISIAYYLLSIRPTTDFIHLTPLLAFSVVNLAIIYKSFKGRYKQLGFVFITAFCIFGGYSAFFRSYYRWNSSMLNQNIFSSNEKVNIWTDNKEAQNISEISGYFSKSSNDEHLFVYNFSPMYYLILDKKNPTPYDYLHTGVISAKEEKEIINALKVKKLRTILSNIEINGKQSEIAEFIFKDYKKVKQINEYSIWEIN